MLSRQKDSRGRPAGDMRRESEGRLTGQAARGEGKGEGRGEVVFIRDASLFSSSPAVVLALRRGW